MRSAIGENIKAIRKRSGLTQYQFAEAIGTTQTSVSGWESRNVKPRDRELIDKICDLFHVTERDIFGYDDGFYAKETGDTSTFGRPLAGSPEPAFLPYLGHAHAGEFEDPATIEYAVVEVPKSVADRHPHGRVITIDGNCVNRVVAPGEIGVVDPDMEPRNGSIVCASIDSGDYILRRMFKGAKQLMLSPDSYSDEYDDIVFGEDDDREVDLVGVLVWHQAAKEME